MDRDTVGDCTWVGRQLPRYLDGELSDPLARQVSTHLDGCADCQQELQKQQQLIEQTIAALVEAEPDRSLPSRISGSVDGVRRSRRRRARTLSWPAAVAALLIVAVTALYFADPFSSRTGSSHRFDSDRGSQVAERGRPERAADPAPDPPNPEPLPYGPLSTAPREPEPPAPAPEAIDPEAIDPEEPLLLVRGDINADGVFSFADLGLILDALRDGTESLPCAAAGDFDGDERLTLADSVEAGRLLSMNTSSPELFSWVGNSHGGQLTCSVYSCP